MEGENIFHVWNFAGQDLFWGHFVSERSAENKLTLNEWGRRMRQWRIALDVARPALRGVVKFPTIGLDPPTQGWERRMD